MPKHLRVSSGLFKSFGSVYVGAEPDIQIPILNHLALSSATSGNSLLHLFCVLENTKPLSAAWGCYKGGLAQDFKALKTPQGKVPCNFQA